MQQYRLRQDGFKEIKKQMLIRIIPFILFILIAAIVWEIISTNNNTGKKGDINSLLIIIPVLIVVFVIATYRALNRQKGLFESYVLTLKSNLITREQKNTPAISIYLNEIKEIIKLKNGNIVIKGKDPTDLMLIPSQMEDYPDLEAALTQIKPISTKVPKSLMLKYQILLAIVILGLMACVYIAKDKIIVAISGTILVAIIIWSHFETKKNKNLDSKTKRGMWWSLLVLASIIAVVIMKLTGTYKK